MLDAAFHVRCVCYAVLSALSSSAPFVARPSRKVLFEARLAGPLQCQRGWALQGMRAPASADVLKSVVFVSFEVPSLICFFCTSFSDVYACCLFVGTANSVGFKQTKKCINTYKLHPAARLAYLREYANGNPYK